MRVLICQLLLGAAVSGAIPAHASPSDVTPDCVYPASRPAIESPSLRETVVAESEPNDTSGQAQPIPISGSDADFSVSGSVAVAFDVDFYRIALRAGDVLGVALLGNGLDPLVALLDGAGASELVVNDDGANAYPAASPLPRKVAQVDSMLSFVAPADGEYLLRAGGYNTSVGTYTLVLRLRRSPFEDSTPGALQTIFLDFDGATIDATAIFGRGASVAALSPLSAFLADWAIDPADESLLIDAIIAEVRADLDAIESVNPAFTYALLNSRDDADPFGQPDVSRVIVGGTTVELGIATIGIAESIDPGNFATAETAVVLLDALSSTNVSNVNSVNNVDRDPSFSKIDAVARRVANSVSHEAGHYLGCWHTNPLNDVYCIMERGSVNLLENRFQTGPDGVMGTADDNPLEFITDEYYASEHVGEPPSMQNADVRVAYALTGAFCRQDINRSGAVDSEDLAAVLTAWASADEAADLNDDGVVDGRDIAAVLAAWGDCAGG